MAQYTFSDVRFENIPEIFSWRYGTWIAIWLRKYSKWGRRCYLPLQYYGEHILLGLGTLNEHGNPHAVIVMIKGDLRGQCMVISPNTDLDRDLIARHAAILAG